MSTYIERKDGTLGTADLFTLRPGRDSDHGFVLDTWLKSDIDSPRSQDMLREGIYWTESKEKARKLLSLYRLTVAHSPVDPDAILGWALTSQLAPPDNLDPLVIYAYVRGGRGVDHGGARRCGIAKALLAKFLPHPCTYLYRPANPKVPIPEHWAYNPERAYR